MARSRLSPQITSGLLGVLLLCLAMPVPATTRTPRPTDTPSSALPDLVVESTRITIPGYTGGCLVSASGNLHLEICIGNRGTTSGPFNLTVNGEHFARVEGIAAGDAVCVFGRYTYPRDTTIFLDDENEVEESDESNNQSTRFVAIPSRPPTCTATPTPTPTPRPCPGDCNGDGKVTVDELILGVNIALERVQFDTCPAYQGQGCPSGSACVAVIVDAVDYALRGCP